MSTSTASGNNGRQSAASLSGELVAYCKSESLTENGLREIIQRHGLAHNNVSDFRFFHFACHNERVTEGIIQCLLEYFPDAARSNYWATTPLHWSCGNNKNVTLGIIRLLLEAAPDSVRSGDIMKDDMPLHNLCSNKHADEATAIKILKFLIEKHPGAVRHANDNGFLPIHLAAGAGAKSSEFCRVLIEAYPGSERITDANGLLPIHRACYRGSLPTVEFLYNLYPESIHRCAGCYPIHYAVQGTTHRDNHHAIAVDIVRFLLECDPNVKVQRGRGLSPLHYACWQEYNDANIEVGIQIMKILFDAHPEEIEDNQIVRNIHRCHQEVQEFINGELVYARQAKDHRLMTTPDDSGRLPLHTALQNNVRLGSIKLLVQGNRSALRLLENSLALPLHVACQHHDSTSVVQYLLCLDEAVLEIGDRQWNTALHCACLGAKYETIALLLEKYDAVSVSKKNADGKLPIDLLWESSAVEDRESLEYTGSVFQLMRAIPQMVQSVIR